MKKNIQYLVLVSGLLIFACAFKLASPEEESEIRKTYGKKDKITISTVSGDCIIKATNQDKIELVVSYTIEPKENFKPVFEEKENELILKEEFSKGNSRGSSKWVLSVPSKTKIKINSASGNIEINGMEEWIDANAASGNITTSHSSGKLKLNCASGNINVNSASGKDQEVSASSASGNVYVNDASAKLNLGSASGNVKVRNYKGDKSQISASSSSGSVSIQ